MNRVFAVMKRRELFNVQVEKAFLDLWSVESVTRLENDSPISRILCLRNILILQNAKHDDAWLLFGGLLKKLLRNNVLSISSLSDQCVALFQKEWDVVSIFIQLFIQLHVFSTIFMRKKQKFTRTKQLFSAHSAEFIEDCI